MHGSVRAAGAPGSADPNLLISYQRLSLHAADSAPPAGYKVRPLRAAARCIPERGGEGHMTVFEKRAVHGHQ